MSTYNLVTLPEGADPLVGPKAAGLARLRRLGFPVPPAAFLPTDAYMEHLRSGEAATALALALAEPRRRSLADLRRTIVEQPLAAAAAAEIERACADLGGGPLAVRSSAIAEDLPHRSFAGQHGTYFVEGPAGVGRAVKHCWASLWSDAAHSYRDHAGIDHAAAAMAVIIQPLVAAECAGVAFSADPVTGSTDRIIVESCFGLGEALVSGKVTPDRFVYSFPAFHLLERTVARKDFEILTGFDGRVYQWDTSPDRASAASLASNTALDLARYAAAVAEGFGRPVDVEWAIEDGRIYLLQARPITGLAAPSVVGPTARPIAGPAARPESASAGRGTARAGPAAGAVSDIAPRADPARGTVWSNMNTGEVLPGVVTPATYSVIVRVGDVVRDNLFGRLGVHFGEEPLFGRFAGRVYFNVSAMASGFAAIPAFSRPDVNRLLGGMQQREESRRSEASLLPQRGATARSRLRFAIGLPGFLRWSLAHGSSKAPAFAARLRAETGALLPPDPATASDEGLARSLDGLLASLNGLTDVLAFAGVAMANYTNLQAICGRWFRDEGPSLANRLVVGLGGLDSARTALDLWRLARLAADEPSLAAALGSASASDDPRALAVACTPPAAAFVDAWDAFHSDHGHHARGELELYTPRWREDPGHLAVLLRGYLAAAAAGEDPLARQETNAAAREELTAALRDRLRDPARRRIFDYVLAQAQAGAVARENLKSEAVRRIDAIRRVLLAVGQSLAGRGLLEDPDDVFFLTLEETQALLRADERPPAQVSPAEGARVRRPAPPPAPAGGPGTDRPPAAALARERRAEYERDGRRRPPAVFVDTLPPLDDHDDHGTPAPGARPGPNTPPDATGASRLTFTGLPVSSGVVEGRARVIPTADAVDEVRPGEILVAPFTDPGWAPFLLPAAGIVMDMGGLLSHGSIIAREYGIPAVVNVGPATGLIRTGWTVRVDGDRGRVEVLDSDTPT